MFLVLKMNDKLFSHDVGAVEKDGYSQFMQMLHMQQVSHAYSWPGSGSGDIHLPEVGHFHYYLGKNHVHSIKLCCTKEHIYIYLATFGNSTRMVQHVTIIFLCMRLWLFICYMSSYVSYDTPWNVFFLHFILSGSSHELAQPITAEREAWSIHQEVQHWVTLETPCDSL